MTMRNFDFAEINSDEKQIGGKRSAKEIPRLILNKARDKAGKKQFLITSMPKSGTTTLRNGLIEYGKCVPTMFSSYMSQTEHELVEEKIFKGLSKNIGNNVVGSSHTKYNYNTLDMIYKYQLKTIVLYRDIRACLASLVDHWKKSTTMPFCHLTNKQLDEAREKSRLTELHIAVLIAAPWYIHFYLSWESLRKSKMYNELPVSIKPIYIRYEDIFNENLDQNFLSLLNKTGLGSKKNVNIKSVSGRFNKGQAKRGKELFMNDSNAQIALENLLDCYPKTDFSQIYGI